MFVLTEPFPASSNRTYLELKLHLVVVVFIFRVRSNRTYLELKRRDEGYNYIRPVCSNCTYLELKHYCKHCKHSIKYDFQFD